MFSSSVKRKTQRSYSVKKSGLKEKFIDRQIWVLHKAMAEKLLSCPHLRAGVIATIESRYQSGRMRHGAYLTWICLMDNISQADLFLEGVLEDTPKMNKLRRHTPFVGVLTEEERQNALLQAACGETSIDTLY